MSQHEATHSETNRTMQNSIATEHLSARSTSVKYQSKYWQKRGIRVLMRNALVFLAALAPVLAAHAAVKVDQSPLILQKPLPPNIVLMLDDSGSMGWNYMPDWNYLKNRGNNDALIDASNNFVYYDPAIVYTPPVRADGTSYPSYTDITQVPVDGFSSSLSNRDLTNYYENPISYSNSYTTTNQVVYQPETWSQCASHSNDPDYYSRSYNYGHKRCTVSYRKTIGAFQYSTGPQSGPYTVHYVANSSCGTLTPCVLASDTSGTDAPAFKVDGVTPLSAGENIANWFAYYHRRILMAKTGLTLAFSTLDPTYRFGFGSIDGNNNSRLPANTYSYSDTYNNKTGYIAQVAPFGDGTTGTQKNNFWRWITTESANNGTPLRQALNAVGRYYQTAQPWVTGGSGSDSGTSYACRPAFTILTTDGFWNGSSQGVGNVDNQTHSVMVSPTPPKPPNYQYTPTAPFMGSASDTLADVAMAYWVNDLQPGIANEVPTTPSDPAFWQHMTTFTMGLGFDPTGITPSSITVPQIFSWATTGTPPTGVTAAQFSWPTPSSGSINNIADLVHAAVNGHGDYFSAKSPTDFVNGLKSALNSIGDRPGAGNAVTESGATVPTVSSATDPFFQLRATYTTGQWSGTLTASTYDTSTTPPGYTLSWSTDAWSPTFTTVSGVDYSDRNVWTTKDGTAAQSVAFKKATDLSSAEQAGLAAGGVPAQTMLNYLLGDHTYEIGSIGGTLRARTAVLGDVVSSTPVYIAAPDKTLYENATFPGATSGPETYQQFVTANANRTPIVYVAANDGMLHAFRVEDGPGYSATGSPVTSQPKGTEVYAYMPEAVLTQSGAGSITNLANKDYGVVNPVDGTQAVPHQYYNDGRMTVQNVYFSSDSKWHTVLVGTTGRGPAKAIYALDITDPKTLMNPATAKNALLWERSAGDGKPGSDYIGEMTGVPRIAQVKQDGATDPSWVVFVGNGYNSAQNKAALLQFNLQTGALTVHTTNSTIDNGLAEPGVMQGNSTTGISTYAFGGDLFGNVWKFDLKTSNSAGSTVFTAKDANGATQPITSLIALTYDSGTDSTFALFGTGKYLAANPDINDAQVQTWYGIRVGAGADLSGAVSTARPVVTDQSARADLTERYAVDLTGGDRATSLQTAGDMDNKVGWYMDLPDTGERIVNRTQFIAGVALVTTMIPKVNDPCKTVPAGAIMFVDPFTGANQTTDYGLGTHSVTFPGQSVAQTVAVNGQVLASGAAGGVTAHHTADGKVSISFNTLDGKLKTLDPLTLGGGADGRVSWRELVN
ncbi:MAG: PilC/PilY family type IV pilus protein [Halothiobacillus sp.]|nr:PilC/PilY family type IV pilus protein [Halothiobacillus sp.]